MKKVRSGSLASKSGFGEPFSANTFKIVGIPVPFPSVSFKSFRNSPILLFRYLLARTIPLSKSDCFKEGSTPLKLIIYRANGRILTSIGSSSS